jgi:hypothetical protein
LEEKERETGIPWGGGKGLGKFATGHRYFLAFAKTHFSIVSLPGTITIS